MRNSIRELTTLICRQREEYVSYDEFYVLINSLNISDDPELCLKWFRQMDTDMDNMLSISELQRNLA